MISLDFKTLARMESHRGVGYVIFVASIFPASFLAQYFATPVEVKSNLLVACITSACVGLLSTTFSILVVFNSLAKSNGSPEQWKQAGAGALAVGSGASLVAQIGSLLVTANGGSFKTYLAWVCLIGLTTAAAFLASDFVLRRRIARQP